MMHVGMNLNSYKGLQFFEGSSPEELLTQLGQISIPYVIISITSSGAKHYAWIYSGERKIEKQVKTKKGENNGSVK